VQTGDAITYRLFGANAQNFSGGAWGPGEEHGDRSNIDAWFCSRYVGAGIVKRVPVPVSLAQERSVNPWFPRSPFGVGRLKAVRDV